LDFTGLTALSRWLHLPDRNGRPGEYAYLFDNATDTLDVNQNTIFGFDMTSLLGSGDEATDILAPVMRYLFYRIEQSLDGRLTNLYLDEGWQLLNHPYWMEKLDGYLVTWRKLNANIIFASQLPKKVIESPIGATLIQGSATQLFLGNQKAEEKDYREGFKLTHREFEIIKNTPIQSRYFLIKQGHEAAVARINLSGLDKYIKVLSATKETVDLCEQIRQEVGDEPSQWLPLFYQEEIGREKP